MTRTAPLRAAARRAAVPVVFLLAAGLASGCAALTNPVADGVPVRRVPAEILGRSKSELQPIPLTLLRRKEITEYRLDKGDILAVVAGDLFGPENQPPPVKPGDQFGGDPAVGYPVPVREDGTISLPHPKLKPIDVRGKTLPEVEALIRRAIEVNTKLFAEGATRVSVELYQKRVVRVQVVREDTVPVAAQGVGTQFLATAKKGSGYIVPLVYGENDVLHALNMTGGLPGLDAKNEVIIQRGTFDPANQDKRWVRIPLRLYPDQPLTISEADIILEEGDILYIESRDSEVFYTAGIVGSRQFPLPRDYDLDVLQALAVAGAPLINGGFTQNLFVAQATATGIGQPSPTLVTVVRKLPCGQQIPIRVDVARAFRDPRERILIQPEDIIVMQEKPGEAVVRYLTQQFRFNTTWLTIVGNRFNQNMTGTVP
jgi:protein involved in polysaccharide export with SLBB domain